MEHVIIGERIYYTTESLKTHMNKQQFKALFAMINHLHKQKYPVLLIIVVVILSLLLMSDDWFPQIFSPASEFSEECQVLKIYDGDTMTLQCPGDSQKTKVRLYCIDTPEMRQKPWGTFARDHLRAITGETVRLVEVDQDRYGRIVGEVYNGEVNLNMAQVEAGQAAVYHAYCQKSDYQTAEDQAKQAKRGIWSQPGFHQAPWEWRKEQRSG